MNKNAEALKAKETTVNAITNLYYRCRGTQMLVSNADCNNRGRVDT